MGERGFRSTVAAWLGEAYYELDQLDIADRWADLALELGASDDALTQMTWRQVRAKVFARRGDHSVAERFAREAVAIGKTIQAPNWQADAYADLGEVLSLSGRTDEAIAALGQALERYERKGNLVMAQRARNRLSQLNAAATSGAGSYRKL
jgi:tetratricopeptide (TPR) repeat protein